MNIDRLQTALYDAREQETLREQVGPKFDELGKVQLLELLRSALEVAAYAIKSAKRGRVGVQPLRFGYLMYLLWEETPSQSEAVGTLLPWIEHAFVTLHSFLHDGSRQSSERRPGEKGLPRSPAQVEVVATKAEALLRSMLEPEFLGPREVEGSGGLVQLASIATVLNRASGYRATTHARRALRPWAALESFVATSGGRVALNTFVSTTPRPMVHLETTAANQALDQLALEWVDPPRRLRPEGISDLVDEERSLGPAEEDAPGNEIHYKVWYGTNRRPLDAGASKGFLDERDTLGVVHFGTCRIRIPKSHKFGSVGTSWFLRWTSRGPDGKLRLLRPIEILDGESFGASLRNALDGGSEGSVLVYVHGYNTTFEEAAIRAAQIGFDLKIDGATAFFSWPSKGQAVGYMADAQAVDASEDSFKSFIGCVAEKSGARAIHFVVHSMGNRLFARTIQDIATACAQAGVAVGAVVLAAPDIDVDVFRSLAKIYPTTCAKTTMYVSDRDRALALSRSFQNSPRAGFTPPITIVDGVDTIEVSEIDLSVLGHTYYAKAAPVLYDIKAVLSGDYDPNKRIRLERRSDPSGVFWAIRS